MCNNMYIFLSKTFPPTPTYTYKLVDFKTLRLLSSGKYNCSYHVNVMSSFENGKSYIIF